MGSTGHLSVKRGKRVLVLMRSGEHFVAKFKEHLHKVIKFYDHEDVATIEIRTLSIFKGSE